jgi:hypothetical protein
VRPRSVVGFSPGRGAIAALAAVVVAAGCGLDPSYDGTHFRCPLEAPTCPAGYTCIAGMCESGVPTDARIDAGPDGMPDGPPDVCALAALAPDNDVCGAAIDVTAAAVTPAGAIVHGDTTGYASNLNPPIIATCTGAPNPGPDAIYRVDANANDVLRLELALTDWDGAIYVLDGCSAAANCLGGADTIDVGSIEMPADVTLAATDTYFIVVDSRLTTATGSGCYTLKVRLL